ncbi:hypothetical protein V1525DRAFT_114185 [Lipomyces kononenkoae]|uniref:Uncharacterized protein n=1 Tax=Lipomyces kononenkoae TaxID=34357 RepID=A0ACC3T398_LIPKO
MYPKPLTAVVRRDPAPNVITLGCPFTVVGLVKLGARESIIKAQFSTGRGAFVIAPIPFCDDAETALDGLPVKYILGPNLVHHIEIKSWKERFPDAKIIGPKGLGQRNGMVVDIEIEDFDSVLSAKDLGMNDIADEEDFKFVCFGGHRTYEVATYHGKSKVLFVADLMVNLPASDQYSVDKSTGILATISRTLNLETKLQPVAGSLLIKDKEAMKKGIKGLSTLDFEKIVVCHGDIIEVDAKTKFSDQFKSLLE